ncbi:hypothetical protein ACIQXA_01415 [Streptomyces massasporeus]|uniref:hypothetical protein n=1 Tax=Streptomyces massasporeus TaxID=67324 RepID=UPI003811AF84
MTHQLRTRACAVLAAALLALTGGWAYAAPARDDMGQDEGCLPDEASMGGAAALDR